MRFRLNSIRWPPHALKFCTLIIARPAFSALLFLTSPLAAQHVVGTVVDSETGQALPGAVVRLIPTRGEEMLVLSDSRGVFRLRGDFGGTFGLRAEMIGRHSWRRERFTGTPDETVQVRIALVPRPIDMASLEAVGERRCGQGLDGAPVVADLWSDISASLLAERITIASRAVELTVEAFEREIERDSSYVVKDLRRQFSASSVEAFPHAPVDQLDTSGFRTETEQGPVLFAPTSLLLLDSWFIDTHCLSLAVATDTSLLAVQFEPNRERSVPEIKGTVYLDTVTRDLRRLDFTFVNMGDVPADVTYDGTMSFVRLRNGAVIPSYWHIRAPIVEAVNLQFGVSRRTIYRVAGEALTGGQVLSATGGGQGLYRAARATVRGFVEGRSEGGPRVLVELIGTNFSAPVDAAGWFVIEGIPPGIYRIAAVAGGTPVDDRLESATRLDLSEPRDTVVHLTVRRIRGR